MTRRPDTRTKRNAPAERNAAAKRNEGAAMLVTMLVLLSSTALAVFAVHSTTFEIRAAGHARQGMQSQYLGETGLNSAMAMVDYQGVDAVLWAMRQQNAEGIKPDMHPHEPDLLQDKQGYRIYHVDIPSTVAVADAESLAAHGPGTDPRAPYDPNFVVDINDHYESVRATPGERADGHGRVRYVHMTYTARGRLVLRSGSDRYEAASNGRAYGLTGPTGR